MAFNGFPRGGTEFFAQLAERQDRDWFKAHKADYERLWEAPMKALFDELHAQLKKTFPGAAKSKPKHFRIYRDVRFSKDKSPFKTSVSAVVPLFGGDANMGTGLYAEFGAKPLVAAGRWMLDGAELTRYRKAVADEKTGAPFAKAVKKAKDTGYEVMVHEALKRVPAPFEQDHPRGELLKLKGFALEFPPLKASQLKDGALVELIVKQTRAIAPLLSWVESAATGRR